ncbi:MAG: DsbE family thiol:disulfide interchange protein [Pseudomonadota bacterium]
MSRKLLIILPLVIFAALATVFTVQLLRGGASNELPSALIGQRIPPLPLVPLPGREATSLSEAYFDNLDPEIDVVALNVFASWCVPCRAEHPQIEAMADMKNVEVVGLNYKDRPEAALAFLQELGDPYAAIGGDPDGRVALDYGVYGVPETFLIDRDGVIRARYAFPILPSNFADQVRPAILEIAGGN